MADQGIAGAAVLCLAATQALTAGQLPGVLAHVGAGAGAVGSSYLAFLDAAPLQAKALTSGFLWMMAEVIAGLSKKAKSRRGDARNSSPSGSATVRRLLAFLVFGMAHGTVSHFYFRALPGLLDRLQFAVGLRVPTAALCVAVDQFLWTPAWYIWMYYPSMGLIEGTGLRHAFSRVRKEWRKTVHKSWALWIPAMAICFAVVPAHLQVPFNAFIGFCWSIVLCLRGAKDETKPADLLMALGEPLPKAIQVLDLPVSVDERLLRPWSSLQHDGQTQERRDRSADHQYVLSQGTAMSQDFVKAMLAMRIVMFKSGVSQRSA